MSFLKERAEKVAGTGRWSVVLPRDIGGSCPSGLLFS